jgi:hypothetical protein
MKRWKLALSLAVVTAIAVPALAGTWRLAPAKWVEFTAAQKKRVEDYMEKTKYCTVLPDADEAFCWIMRNRLGEDGIWYPPERVTPTYLAKNFFTIGGTFVLTFALVMLVPTVGRHYLAWLRK